MITTFQLNISDEAAFALIQSVFFEDIPPIGRFHSRTLINDFHLVFPCIRKACAEQTRARSAPILRLVVNCIIFCLLDFVLKVVDWFP